MSQAERRKHPRFAFDRLTASLVLHWPERPPQDLAPNLEPRNISRGGVKIMANFRFAVFQRLRVSLLAEDGSTLAEESGKVVRVEEIDLGTGTPFFGIAIAFEGEGMDLQEAIREANGESTQAAASKK